MNQDSPPAQAALSDNNECLNHCVVGQCRPGCSLQVITGLLSEPALLTGEQADLLLDLHQALKARSDAEMALRLFCEIREHLEARHYLAMYRLRRWFENHVTAELSSEKDAKLTIPIRLKHGDFEVLRRQCLCAALNANFENPSRLTFTFRSLLTEPTSLPGI